MEENIKTNTRYEEEDEDLIGLITSSADASGQYVIFRNGFDKLYAINVAKIEELIALSELEITPNSDHFSLIVGVSKIRGDVLPIVSFDRWLGSEADSGVYELVMICNYGGKRFAMIIKNVIGILSIDSKKMIDNSDKDPKTSFVTEVSIGGITGLCLVFDSDKLLMETFPKIESTEIAKTHGITLGRGLRGKLLSAEDSSVIRGALQTIYEQLGLDYELFHNGAELLERLRELDSENVSLIVTDLEMPVMDGIKLIEAIREDQRYASIPVVVNTNMANESVSTKCRSLGVAHIISKLDVDDMVDTIRKYAL